MAAGIGTLVWNIGEITRFLSKKKVVHHLKIKGKTGFPPGTIAS
jgi:hypothetical protein